MSNVPDALARARADLAEGRAWKARDRLDGLLSHRCDDEVVDLLARASYAMGDLPAAGALWFVLGSDGPQVREAQAAWRERCGSDEARWHSLPRCVRRTYDSPHLLELERAARREQKQVVERHRAEHRAVMDAYDDPTTFGGYALCGAVLFLLGLAVLGAISVVDAVLH